MINLVLRTILLLPFSYIPLSASLSPSSVDSFIFFSLSLVYISSTMVLAAASLPLLLLLVMVEEQPHHNIISKAIVGACVYKKTIELFSFFSFSAYSLFSFLLSPLPCLLVRCSCFLLVFHFLFFLLLCFVRSLFLFLHPLGLSYIHGVLYGLPSRTLCCMTSASIDV